MMISEYFTGQEYLIITGRFQPLHNLHLDTFRKILQGNKYHLIVCVLKNNTTQISKKRSQYAIESSKVQKKENNPLPVWKRVMLLNLAIANDDILKSRVTVLARERPDIDWVKSIEDLPENRIWVFNIGNGEFDKTKVEFYKNKNEKMLIVDFPSPLSGTQIRERLRNGNKNFDFLPECCWSFFQQECFSQILKK